MCSVVKGQLIGELAIRCACCWAFRGEELRELRGACCASIMYDYSRVLVESRGVECGERAFDAKQVEAWQKAQKKLPEAMGFEELSLLINGGFRLILSNYLEA